MLVGFQGEPGAFSEEAAQAYFGEIGTRGYRSFDALLRAVDAGDVRYGLLPCENSIHGPVVQAYDLLYAYPRVHIVGETVHRIVQAVIGVPGATLSGLRRIESHPVALEQCRRFLQGMPDVEPVAVADTAGAVRTVVAAGDPARAAIGPAASATRYGGAVLADAVQDEPKNFTRFLAIGLETRDRPPVGRAALAFVLPHRTGSLHGALGRVAQVGLNLRSLVARPLPGRPFEYIFYAEIECPDRARAEILTWEIGDEARLLGFY